MFYIGNVVGDYWGWFVYGGFVVVLFGEVMCWFFNCFDVVLCVYMDFFDEMWGDKFVVIIF